MGYQDGKKSILAKYDEEEEREGFVLGQEAKPRRKEIEGGESLETKKVFESDFAPQRR